MKRVTELSGAETGSVGRIASALVPFYKTNEEQNSAKHNSTMADVNETEALAST